MFRRYVILFLVLGIISVLVCASFTSSSSSGVHGTDHSKRINDNLQVLLYVARYRDGEIANQALDAAIHITGRADAREEAYARTLSDRDIHKIIRECNHSRFMARLHHAFHVCKPALYFSFGLFVLLRFF